MTAADPTLTSTISSVSRVSIARRQTAPRAETHRRRYLYRPRCHYSRAVSAYLDGSPAVANGKRQPKLALLIIAGDTLAGPVFRAFASL